MGNRPGGVDTICPFYIRESGKSITCEGIVDDIMMQHKFATEDDKMAYQRRYCYKWDYAECVHAKSLVKKYGDTDEE